MERFLFFRAAWRNKNYSSWKGTGWDSEIIRKAQNLFFYGCINAIGDKMTKEEFMKTMFNYMTQTK